MQEYAEQVKYAVETTVPAIWHEFDEAAALHQQFHQLEAQMRADYSRAEAPALNVEDADDAAMATGAYWDTYFGSDKKQHETKLSLIELRERLAVRRFSVATLSGSLLQVGKQALSVVHGGLKSAPEGRKVGGQPLSEVIWQARNQALHWEEGRFNAAVVQCFEQLEADFGSSLSGYTTKSLAFEVVRVLGWRTADAVFDDLRQLA